ncbi:MAG: hypothetical protein M1835_002360 [Candelina submexicana]|nr:MAG: hypothetical protein M1835_002360 [Candelina submexicana]
MPYLPTSQEWLTQSSLLLQARPSSARITTKYTIAPPQAPKTTSSSAQPHSPAHSTIPPPARGILIVKTYDPISGACLKYRTNKAAEVGRLIASLGRLGTLMIGQAVQGEPSLDATMADPPPIEEATGTSTPVTEVVPVKEQKKDSGGDTKGGGGKKKKKGRK